MFYPSSQNKGHYLMISFCLLHQQYFLFSWKTLLHSCFSLSCIIDTRLLQVHIICLYPLTKKKTNLPRKNCVCSLSKFGSFLGLLNNSKQSFFSTAVAIAKDTSDLPHSHMQWSRCLTSCCLICGL